jgi:SAM-dependent methyltransferase
LVDIFIEILSIDKLYLRHMMTNAMPKRFRWKVAQWFERQWWRWYLGSKDKTSYLVWKRAYWADFLRSLDIHLAPGGRIADLGCGPAGLFILFDATHEVEAVDPLIHHYSKQLVHFNQAEYPNTRFVESALETWRPSGVWQAIFCINAINHVSEIEMALASIKNAWAPGQTLVITTDAHRRKWLQRIFALAPGDILHPHQYTLKGYLDLITHAGFPKPETKLIKREGIFDYYAFVWR